MRWHGAAATAMVALACGSNGGGVGGGDDRHPVRLVDHFADAAVEGSAGDAGQPPRTEWTFDGSSAPAEWKALAGVAGMRVEDGALRGASTPPVPILGLEWTPRPEQRDDHIHSIEIKLRASGGGRVSAAANTEEQLFIPALMGNPFAWQFTSPLVPGETAQVYTLRPIRPVAASAVKRLLLQPVDAPGAEFAIESVRVVFEREHLAAIPAGLSWQGLSGMFRETLVARSPETLGFDVALPADPYVELGVGTLARGAVTFVVEVAAAGENEPRTLRRTVTSPQRWEDVSLGLDGLGGKDARVSLRLEADGPGAIGLWGSPVVRSRLDPGARSDRPQGVVVVIIDTLRRDHLDTWGYDRETAPTLSRLAAEGVVADDALSQAPWTKVSVPSILTSLHPTSHTVLDFPDVLPASADTLAEQFRKAGYATLGFSAIPFTGKMTNLHQGYEQFRESDLDLGTGGTVQDKTARRYVDDLLRWLEGHRDVPFFALLHVEDPHSPYYAPRPFAEIWGKPGDPDRYSELIEQVRPKIDHPLMRAFGMPARSDIAEVGIDERELLGYERDAYDGLIRATDAEIARVVERLDELGLRDRVLIALTSDHGTEFLDHGQHFHGHSVYGELNRVPMFFWGPPFVPAGVRIPATVRNLDFMPTVLEIARLPVPDAAQGQSLVPWFAAGGEESAAAGKGWRRAPAITEKPYLPVREFGPGYASYSIVSDGWKLIHNTFVSAPAGGPGGPPPVAGGGIPGPGGPPGAAGGPPPMPPVEPLPEYQLYNHAEDPINQHDVAAEHPEKVKELAEQLARWREVVEGQKLESDAEMAASASPEELERLRALGYL